MNKELNKPFGGFLASELRRNSLWMIGGQGFAIAFQAIYFVLIGRALGSGEYGAFVGVASLISVFGQFSSLGMELILIRDVSRDRDRFPYAWGSALETAAVGFFTVTALSILVGRFVLSSEVRVLIPLIALSDLLFAKVAVLASKAFQALGDFGLSANLIALTNLTRAGVAAILYLGYVKTKVHPTAYNWVQIYWLSSFAAAVVGFAAVTLRYGFPKWTRITAETLREGLSFSLSSSSISIYNDIDKTFLVSLGQVSVAGIYTAAYRIVDVASVPIYGAFTAAFPQFFREGIKSARYARDFSVKLLYKVVPYSVLAALFMAAFSSSVIPYVMGSSFQGSASVLRWLCLLPLIRCFHYAAGSAITGSVSQWYRTIQQIIAAILNVALNAILIPRFSWQGAALASLLTDGTLAAMNWICLASLISRQEKAAGLVPAAAGLHDH